MKVRPNDAELGLWDVSGTANNKRYHFYFYIFYFRKLFETQVVQFLQRMGRKSSVKSKERRLKRKEEQQKILLAMSVVDKANKLTDPLEPFPVFRKYNKNGIEAELYVKRVTELDESMKSWIFSLTKKNMQLKYEQCSWGWSDTKKMEELTDEAAWYLISQAVDGTLLGFSHFRFDVDEGMEVLYWYNLLKKYFISNFE
jgi:hypothetical protein